MAVYLLCVGGELDMGAAEKEVRILINILISLENMESYKMNYNGVNLLWF